MKAILRFVVYATIIIGELTLLELNMRFSLYLAVCFFFVLLLGLLLKESSKQRKHLLVTVSLCYLILLGYVILGRVHVQQAGNSFELYSPLHLNKLEEGCERIDTINACISLEVCFNEYSPRTEEFYFVKKNDMVFVYNRFRKVFSVRDGEYEIIQRDYNGVPINLLADENGIFSFYGERLNNSWKPYVHDETPVDPNF